MSKDIKCEHSFIDKFGIYACQECGNEYNSSICPYCKELTENFDSISKAPCACNNCLKECDATIEDTY